MGLAMLSDRLNTGIYSGIAAIAHICRFLTSMLQNQNQLFHLAAWSFRVGARAAKQLLYYFK
jgi:hypothetical protein